MKIGVVGKGGTGKTSISALLAQACAQRGQRVVAIDTDSNPNLALSLGLSTADVDAAPLLPRSLVVGVGDGQAAPADLLADYGVATPAGVTLLQTMWVDEAAGGCMCGSHASVRSLLGAALEDEVDVAVVDMEAGLEHLARSGGTLAYADVLLTVMEPTRKAAVTAARTRDLAVELDIPRVYAVGNKAREGDDAFFAEACAAEGLDLAGVVPFDRDVAAADQLGGLLGPDQAAAARHAVGELVARVCSPAEERAALQRMRDRIDDRIGELERSR